MFIPCRKMLRKMIRAVLNFGGKESHSKFLLRFGFNSHEDSNED